MTGGTAAYFPGWRGAGRPIEADAEHGLADMRTVDAVHDAAQRVEL